MNMLELKDALIDDLNNNGDMTSVLWKYGKSISHKKLDWLKYESAQRLIFQLYVGNTINDHQCLVALSELLGAFTGRGVGF